MKFQAHGIKVDGKLHKVRYNLSTYRDGSRHLNVDAKGYERLPIEIRQAFVIKNETDSHSDYFDTDSFKVAKTHPLFSEVVGAFIKSNEFQAKILDKQIAKRGYPKENFYRIRIEEMKEFVAM